MSFLNPLKLFGGGVAFHPDRDIPDLAGKVILVTGGNTGLGKETVLQLAKHNPAVIYLAARTESKATQAIQEIEAALTNPAKIVYLPLDLTAKKSIQAAAAEFISKESRLDILILNAGIMMTPPGQTDLGHEIQLGTNHTGHFLFTKLLLPTLTRTAEEPNSDVRVVSVSSEGHKMSPDLGSILDQEKLANFITQRRYGASKAANIYFAAELARRYPNLTSVSIHPGVILTDLYASISKSVPLFGGASKALSFLFTKVDAGAYNQLWASTTAKENVVSGSYYVPIGNLKSGNALASNQEQGKKLWEWTEAELAKNGC